MKLQVLKKIFTLNTSLFVAIIVSVPTVNAETITLKFEGVVTEVDEQIRRDNASESVSGFRDSIAFSPGDKFSGTYTYNANTINQGTFGIFEYLGAISSMSFVSNNTEMATSTGGDILLDADTSDSVMHSVNFPAVSGNDITYRAGSPPLTPNETIYKPLKMGLFWISPGSSATDIKNPHFDSSKNWGDENDWAIPAPNYGDIQLTYSQVSGSSEAVMSGRLYSVSQIPNPPIFQIPDCIYLNNCNFDFDFKKIDQPIPH